MFFVVLVSSVSCVCGVR